MNGSCWPEAEQNTRRNFLWNRSKEDGSDWSKTVELLLEFWGKQTIESKHDTNMNMDSGWLFSHTSLSITTPIEPRKMQVERRLRIQTKQINCYGVAGDRISSDALRSLRSDGLCAGFWAYKKYTPKSECVSVSSPNPFSYTALYITLKIFKISTRFFTLAKYSINKKVDNMIFITSQFFNKKSVEI